MGQVFMEHLHPSRTRLSDFPLFYSISSMYTFYKTKKGSKVVFVKESSILLKEEMCVLPQQFFAHVTRTLTQSTNHQVMQRALFL